jgi:hypothetical protein
LKKFGINAPLFMLLSIVYPELEWLPWKFQQQVPMGFWEDRYNQKKFVNWASTELKINEMSDWYNVTTNVKMAGICLIF